MLERHYGFRGEPAAFHQIGAEYDISGPRCQQIEARALKRLSRGFSGLIVALLLPLQC
jgi:DNA-directed RNA polymerase sigma subunit (sigma70/sigma32)